MLPRIGYPMQTKFPVEYGLYCEVVVNAVNKPIVIYDQLDLTTILGKFTLYIQALGQNLVGGYLRGNVDLLKNDNLHFHINVY